MEAGATTRQRYEKSLGWKAERSRDGLRAGSLRRSNDVSTFSSVLAQATVGRGREVRCACGRGKALLLRAGK